MTSTDHQKATRQGSVDELLAPDAHARKPVSSNRLLGSLKEAVSWPGAERNTMVTLALSLVAARADEEGSSYFQDLSDRNPADPTAQALAGFFQVRAGDDVAVAVAKLDKAATLEPGLPQYFRGLALSELLPDDGAQEIGLTTADTARADQVMADLEFVLAARDQFPVLLLRAAHQVPRPRLPGARARATGGRGAATVRLGPGRGPAADVHEFLAYCARRDAVVRTGVAQPRAKRPRRPVLRLWRLCVHQDNRGTSRDRRRFEPGPRAGRDGRSWLEGPGSCQSPDSHARSLRPRRRRRGRDWPPHGGHRLRSIPG